MVDRCVRNMVVLSDSKNDSMDSTAVLDVSIVIAVRDEEDCIEPLIKEIAEVLADWDKTFEVILIDDGSTDRTLELILQLKKTYSFIRCYSLPKPQSKTAGLLVGFKNARGQLIVTWDGDLQNDPRDLPTVVQAAGPGILVCGARPKRADTFLKRRASKIANYVRRRVLADDAVDSGCGVKVFPREAIECIPPIRGVHRFFASVLKVQGYRIVNVPINDRQRTLGETKYGNLDRLRRTLPDLFGFSWWIRRILDLNADKRD